MHWRIKGIKIGEIFGDYSFNVAHRHMGEKVWVPSMVWYLAAGEHRVLFDTGFGDPAALSQPLFQTRRERTLEEVLQREACPSEEISDVILSHLHWDHCADLSAFSSANLFVQHSEWDFALTAPSICAGAFDSPSIGRVPNWLESHFTLLTNDVELYPGLRIVQTPGHTPGHQSLIVRASDGRTIGLAGDLFPRAENYSGEPGSRYLPPSCLDVMEWLRSAKKFASQCDVIVPSHDPALKTGWLDA